MTVRNYMRIALGLLIAFSIVRAANSKYQAQYQEIRKQAAEAQQKMGLTREKNAKELFAQFPTPQLVFNKPTAIQPGATADVSVSGKFPPGTRFLFDNDDVEVVKEAAVGTQYKATVKTAPAAMFGFTQLHAIAPVSLAERTDSIVFIGAKHNWELNASNGWKINLTMKGTGFEITDPQNAKAAYTAEFFRPNETKAFETLEARLNLSRSDGYFSFSLGDAPSSAQAELAQIQAQMKDPSFFTKPGSDKVLARMQELSQIMNKEIMAKVGDPKAIQQRQDEFGCQGIGLNVTGLTGKGTMGCGAKIKTLNVTGTMTLVK